MNKPLTPKDTDKLPFERTDNLLTPAEQEFYRALQRAVVGRWSIQMKVRLADLVKVEKDTDSFYTHFNRVSAKHVDFVLCRLNTTVPDLIIELDDSSHNRPDRKERDALVDQVLSSAGIPILHIPWSRSYNPMELSDQIEEKTGRPTWQPIQPVPSYTSQTFSPDMANTPRYENTDSIAHPVQSTQPLRREPSFTPSYEAKPYQIPQRTIKDKSRSIRRRRILGALLVRLATLIFGLGIFLAFMSTFNGNSLLLTFALPTPLPPLTASPLQAWTPTFINPGIVAADVTAMVNTANLNLRAGPGKSYSELGAYPQGTRAKVVGKEPSGTWLKVRLPNGTDGWMSIRFLQVNGSLVDVPLVEVPPTPVQ